MREFEPLPVPPVNEPRQDADREEPPPEPARQDGREPPEEDNGRS